MEMKAHRLLCCLTMLVATSRGFLDTGGMFFDIIMIDDIILK